MRQRQGSTARRGGPEHATKRRASGGIHAADPNPAGMTVDNELGVLDTEDVEATLQDHFDDIRGCYQRAGKAQRYAGGRVHAALPRRRRRASPQDVLVVESTPGQLRRRTLPGRGRAPDRVPRADRQQADDVRIPGRVPLDEPARRAGGRRAEARSRPLGVPAPARRLRAARRRGRERDHLHRAERLPGLGRAWRPASTLDEDVGDCMVQTIRRWKMSATLPGHVMRATFSIPPAIATAEATPRRTAGHRRRTERRLAVRRTARRGPPQLRVLAAVDDVDAPGRSPARRRGAASSSSRGRRSSRRTR